MTDDLKINSIHRTTRVEPIKPSNEQGAYQDGKNMPQHQDQGQNESTGNDEKDQTSEQGESLICVEREILVCFDEQTGDLSMMIKELEENQVVRYMPKDKTVDLAQNLQQDGQIINIKI